jgi:hypothetical protein
MAILIIAACGERDPRRAKLSAARRGASMQRS